MNSGKSAALIQVAYNYEANKKKIFVIKSVIDTKGGNFLKSRVGLEKKVDLVLNIDESLKNYFDEIKKVDCVLVDEAQFLKSEKLMICFI